MRGGRGGVWGGEVGEVWESPVPIKSVDLRHPGSALCTGIFFFFNIQPHFYLRLSCKHITEI